VANGVPFAQSLNHYDRVAHRFLKSRHLKSRN